MRGGDRNLGPTRRLELREKFKIIITLSRLYRRLCRQNTAVRVPVIKTRRRDVIIIKKSVQHNSHLHCMYDQDRVT